MLFPRGPVPTPERLEKARRSLLRDETSFQLSSLKARGLCARFLESTLKAALVLALFAPLPALSAPAQPSPSPKASPVRDVFAPPAATPTGPRKVYGGPRPRPQASVAPVPPPPANRGPAPVYGGAPPKQKP